MFRHGQPRAFIHNLRLASMLSFVAGSVNIAGVLAIGTLTTNVTGHFAFFAEDFVESRYQPAFVYFSYILAFLAGAFVCNLLMELGLRRGRRDVHAIPMLLEAGILATVALVSSAYEVDHRLIANAMLFAMGLQNALVTKISKATVRTTHLTGLFTDLGIELSQLFFYVRPNESQKLKRSIYLRLTIIAFFFLGGVIGGFLFISFQNKALLFSSAFLVVALLYDTIRFSYHYYRRKITRR